MSAQNSNGLTISSSTGTTVTVTANDDVVVTSNAGAIAVSIPSAAALQKGKVYRFSNQGAGVATITPAAGTIDGAATQTVPALASGKPGTTTLVSDGTNWFSIVK